MKIIYVSNSIIPSQKANSVHVMKMCEAFVKKGNKVILLCRSGDRKEDINDFNYYGIKEKFEIKKIWWPPVRGGGLIYGFLVGLFLRNISKDFIIYGRSIYGIFQASKKGFNCIFEAHTPPGNNIHYKMEEKLFKLNFFVGLVTITHALKDEYLRIFPFLGDKKIKVAPDGANLPSGKRKKLVSWPGRNDTMQAGYVGSLYSGKGMEIISSLVKIIKNVDFHIVGGKEEDIRFWKERIKSENVYFHGFIPHGKLASYYEKFDIVLVPFQKRISLSGNKGDISRWTSPLKIFEYMAHGKAIISSELPVIKEVLINNQNALLCNPENINEWVEAINRLKDINLRKFLGENARKELEAKYTWEKRAEAVLMGI